MPEKLFTLLADKVGNATGDVDANEDYSSTAVEFKVTCPAGQHMVIARTLIAIRAGTIAQITGYGGSNSALTNGIKVYVTDNLGQIQYYLAGQQEAIKTHGGWAAICYDTSVVAGFASGDDIFHLRWTFTKYGADRGVELLPGWSLNFLCQDDFTVPTGAAVLRQVFVCEGKYLQPGIGADEGHA